jgi:predicted HAD superfamily hydrolase
MDPANALFDVGREVLGPAFACFTHRVLERARALRLDRLLFISREGFLLQRLYWKLAANLDAKDAPGSGYVYLSRLSTALPSVHAFGLRELRLGSHLGPVRSIKGILNAFDLCDPEVLALVREAGVRDPEAPIDDWWSSPLLRRLIESDALQALIAARARVARDRLKRYLAGEAMFARGRVALVDVGWAGNIQNNVMEAFANDPDFSELWGLYLCLWRGAYPPNDDSWLPRKEGLFVDWKRHRVLPARALLLIPDLFEVAARAEHGTTLGYRDVAGGVEPILKTSGDSHEVERKSEPAVAHLRRGIEAFADGYPAWLARHGSLEEATAEALRRIERFVFYPKPEELRSLGALSQTDDWGLDSHRPLIEISRGGPRLLGLASWRESLRRSKWKSAYLMQTAGPVACRVYHRYVGLRPHLLP